ncbi:site-specific DNA-methyltransferase [Limnohabitans sp.]|uniref:site-specific DNA-methyltransferase n=1 Tax=Limnohabitans sp. TaxID=1907725 RepID=UPI00311D2F8B
MLTLDVRKTCATAPCALLEPQNAMTTTPHAPHDLSHSPDALAQRRAELLALLSQTAPEVLSDHQQINVDKLKALLGEEHIAGDEHYELSWAGKSAARREIQKASSHTLLPDANNPAQAQHMLIEGENLEVLRVLQKSYYGKVKMIYIDPPYNTGNDSFVYPDDYSETLEEYQKRTGEKNEAGYMNKQSLWKKNSKESGQYHSAWLSMMYPRLYLARNLLRDDGVIFISIDDNEAANLKLLCDEVFGAENFVANFVWEKRTNRENRKAISSRHDHVICYAKDFSNPSRSIKQIPMTEKALANYKNPDDDPRGLWKSDPATAQAGHGTKSQFYVLNAPNGKTHSLESGRCWLYTKEVMEEEIKAGKIWFGRDGNGVPRVKTYLNAKERGLTPETIVFAADVGTNESAKNNLKDLFDSVSAFETPKPVDLVKHFLSFGGGEGVILDFFAGSGCTKQAVLELNSEDGGNRQSISVQIPEFLDADSEAYKAGYRTIADITRARIDKVIDKLKAEHPDKTADLACAHFTLAPSNFKVWRGDVNDAQALRDQLALFQSAEKTGQARQAVDAQTAMLTELLLKHGLGALGVHAIAKPLQVAGVTVHRVLAHDDKPMWLCFEPYTEALRDEIVRARPAQVVMLNSCFVGQDGHGADEQLSNLQLELAGLNIGLTVI